MRFWDSSAVVPLLVEERPTGAMRALVQQDSQLIVWALTGVEVTSALWRRVRGGDASAEDCDRALTILSELEACWTAVVDLASVQRRARRLLASHPLRAADACQLAAALVVARDEPEQLGFVTLDDRLAEAARREGLRVVTG